MKKLNLNKEILKKVRRIKLLQLDIIATQKELDEIKNEIPLEQQELQFSRNDTKQLCEKYSNKRYDAHKQDILDEITKRYNKIMK